MIQAEGEITGPEGGAGRGWTRSRGFGSGSSLKKGSGRSSDRPFLGAIPRPGVFPPGGRDVFLRELCQGYQRNRPFGRTVAARLCAFVNLRGVEVIARPQGARRIGDRRQEDVWRAGGAGKGHRIERGCQLVVR